MKKMLLATAGPAYYRMYSTDVYNKQNRQMATKTITHHFIRFWNWAENCRLSQNLAARDHGKQTSKHS